MGYGIPITAGFIAGTQAKTADLDALAKTAREESQTGASRYIDTTPYGSQQWFVRDASSDEIPYRYGFEVSDYNAALTKPLQDVITPRVVPTNVDSVFNAIGTKEGVPLGSILKHDKLFEAYPELANIKVKQDDLLRDEGTPMYVFNSNPTEIFVNPDIYKYPPEEQARMLMHEIQHIIDLKEEKRGSLSSSESAISSAGKYSYDPEYKASLRAEAYHSSPLEQDAFLTMDRMKEIQTHKVPSTTQVMLEARRAKNFLFNTAELSDAELTAVATQLVKTGTAVVKDRKLNFSDFDTKTQYKLEEISRKQ